MSEYRVEIPVIVTDQSDASALKNLENTLNRILQTAQQTQDNSARMFREIRSGAEQAANGVEQMGDAARAASTAFSTAATDAENAGSTQQSAANGAKSAEDQLKDSVVQTSESIKEQGNTARESGNKAKESFRGASEEADKFSQRIQKSQQTLRQMFAEQLKLVIEAVDKASPVLKEIGSTLKNLAGRAWNITMKITDLATAPLRKVFSMIANPATMALSVAGVSFGAQDFVSTYNEFESTMSNVRALTGATQSEYDQLVSKAKELGENTVFSASEAAEGMTYLGMAGWSTNQILDAMPGLLSLASAGATDLGTASDIVSDVMTAFGMSAEMASHAADVFAKTATSSNTTVSGLGESLKYAAPIAKSFGMTLEDTSAILGMMANAGIKGSQGGTAVRSALLRLAAPAKQAQEWMDRINLSFVDAGGQMKSMEKILEDTKEAFSSLTQQEQLDAAKDIFGTEAASAWLAVIDQGAEAYSEFRDALIDSKGVSEDMSNIQLDNLAGDFKLLQSAAEGLKLSVMERLNPVLREGTQWLTNKIPEIKELAVGAVDAVVSKISEIKERFDEVINGSEFQNADSFAEKFSIAWDQIIAEPFSKWWNSKGREMILGIVSAVAEGLGAFWNGAITGIISGITGQEIDTSGMNLSGFALAGAEGAKTFVSSFASALNIGELFSELPAGLKIGAGLFAGFKLTGAVKTVSGWGTQLSQIFGPLITQIGAMNTGFNALQIAMGAIVSPAGIAALALAGVTAAFIYASGQAEEHRQELMHVGDTVQEAAERYRESAEQIREYADAIQTKREIEIRIKQGSNNQKTITEAEAQLADIDGRIAWLEVRLSDTSLTEEDIARYKSEIAQIKDRKAEIETALKSGSLTEQEVSDYKTEWNLINDRQAYLEAALKAGSLTAEDITAYQAQLDELKGKKVELEAVLSENRVRKADIDSYVAELSGLESRTAEITAILNSDQCDPDEAKLLWSELDIIQERTATLHLKLDDEGFSYADAEKMVNLFKENQTMTSTATLIIEKAGYSTDDAKKLADDMRSQFAEKAKLEVLLTTPTDDESVKTLEAQLKEIQEKKIQIEAEYLIEGKWANEAAEAKWGKLFEQEQLIQLKLSAADLTDEQLGALMEKYAQTEGAINMTLQLLAETDMPVEDIEKLKNLMEEMSDKDVIYNVALNKTGNMDRGQLDQLLEDLDEANKKIEAIDIERLELEAAANLVELKNANYEAAKTLPAQAAQRDAYKAQMDSSKADYDSLDEKIKATEKLEFERQAVAGTIRGLEKRRDDLKAELKRVTPHWWESGQEKEAAKPKMDELKSRIDSYEEAIDAAYEQMSGLQDRYKDMYGSSPGRGYLVTKNGKFSSESAQEERDYVMQKYNEASDNYEQQSASLQDVYNGKKQEIEAETFNGLDDWRYIGRSLEEMAADWPNLTEKAKEAVAEALNKLEQYNVSDEGQYYSEDQKTNPEQIVELADKATLMASLQEHVQGLADRYNAMDSESRAAFESSEEGEAALSKLNETLQTLGLDGVTSLSQINTAMDEIRTAGQNLDQITLEQIQQAFVTLTGDAQEAASTVSGVKSELTNLNGTVAHAYLYLHETTIKSNSYSSGNYRERARGGIITAPELSWIGEAGPEAVIPLSENKRGRALDLYYQTGEMLGVGQFADGGIIAPYRSAIEQSLDNDDSEQNGWMYNDDIAPARNGASLESLAVNVNVASNPTIEINGADMSPDELINTLRSKQKELAQMLGQEMADELEAIMSNMVI